MSHIKSISSLFSILLAGCFATGALAEADEKTPLRDRQSPPIASDASVTVSAKLASKSEAAASPAKTKDETVEAVIRKTEPLPQFYFPY